MWGQCCSGATGPRADFVQLGPAQCQAGLRQELSLSLQCAFCINWVALIVLHLVWSCWGSLCSGLSASGCPLQLWCSPGASNCPWGDVGHHGLRLGQQGATQLVPEVRDTWCSQQLWGPSCACVHCPHGGLDMPSIAKFAPVLWAGL